MALLSRILGIGRSEAEGILQSEERRVRLASALDVPEVALLHPDVALARQVARVSRRRLFAGLGAVAAGLAFAPGAELYRLGWVTGLTWRRGSVEVEFLTAGGKHVLLELPNLMEPELNTVVAIANGAIRTDIVPTAAECESLVGFERIGIQLTGGACGIISKHVVSLPKMGRAFMALPS